MQVQQVIITGQNAVELQARTMNDALGAEELRIKTEWTFISAGTELANYTGKEPDVFRPGSWCAYPWNSGYANIGTVTAAGAGVTRAKVGDRVFTCGAHSSMITVNQNNLVVAVPSGLDPALAVATRMAGVGSSAAVMAEIPLNPWVVVYGLGMVGNLAAQSFRILGGRVIGVDPVESRRRRATECGIAHTVGGTPEETAKAVAEITGGAMADISIEATGLTPVVLQALKNTANLGQLILLGSPRAPFKGDMTRVFSDIHLRYITVRGALEWAPPTYPPAGSMGGRTGAMISLYEKQLMIFDWVRNGQMQVTPLLSHRLTPDRIKEAYEGLLRQPETYVGVALDWRAM